jgi:hypothetical protein
MFRETKLVWPLWASFRVRHSAYHGDYERYCYYHRYDGDTGTGITTKTITTSITTIIMITTMTTIMTMIMIMSITTMIMSIMTKIMTMTMTTTTTNGWC